MKVVYLEIPKGLSASRVLHPLDHLEEKQKLNYKKQTQHHCSADKQLKTRAWIRIRIHFPSWIRIRIQNPDPDPHSKSGSGSTRENLREKNIKNARKLVVIAIVLKK